MDVEMKLKGLFYTKDKAILVTYRQAVLWDVLVTVTISQLSEKMWALAPMNLRGAK